LGYYERNLAVLRLKRADLADKIEKAVIVPVDDPENLAPDFLAELGARGIVFLMGIGSGKTVSQIASKLTSKQGLVAFEADLGVLKYAMTKRSLVKFFNLNDLMFFTEEIADWSFIHHIHMRVTNEVCLQIEEKFSTKLHPEIYEKATARLLEEKLYSDVNLGTCISLGRHFCNSILRNIPTIMKSQGVKSLYGIFPDCPAIVCSSGPSLDYELETLKKAKGQAVIISIDTALPHLLSHGVVPDIVCGIDPLNDNKILFKNHRDMLKNVPGVFLAQYTPDVMATYPGPVFVGAMPGNQMYFWLMPFWEEKGNVECFGGSVSHFATELAQYLGCSRIALVGQDLCYKQKYHAGQITKLLHDGMGLEEPDETELGYLTKNRLGDDVRTKVHLQSFRFAFENKIKSNPDLKIINTTVDGIEIKGADFMTLDEYISHHGVEIDTEAAFNYIQSKKPVHVMNTLADALDNVIHIFRVISHTCLKILKLAHKVKDLRASNGDRAEIRRLVKEIEKLRPITQHPLTALISSYYHHIELYINKSAVKDIDEMHHKWKRLDAQVERGLNFYGELREGVATLTKELVRLRKKIAKKVEEDHGLAAANS